MEQITSRQNALVKRLRELVRGDTATDDVLLEGVHLLQEACASDLDVELAAFATDAMTGPLASLAQQLAARGTRIVTMPPRLFESVSPVRRPAGALGVTRLRRATVEDVLARTPQHVVLLDHVQDPGNVGAIVRAAEAFGVTGLIAGPGTADPFGWKALRGSMGSTFRLPTAVSASTIGAITTARRLGLRIIATVARGGVPARLAPLAGASLLVLGSEGTGLPPEVAEAADDRITIEMQPPVESLNVAVAAALIAYEAARQRNDVPVR